MEKKGVIQVWSGYYEFTFHSNTYKGVEYYISNVFLDPLHTNTSYITHTHTNTRRLETEDILKMKKDEMMKYIWVYLFVCDTLYTSHTHTHAVRRVRHNIHSHPLLRRRHHHHNHPHPHPNTTQSNNNSHNRRVPRLNRVAIL